MRIRSSRSAGLLAAVVLTVGLGALPGCGNPQEAGHSTREADGDSARARAQRARHVAAAWDGSAAAAKWRAGYHPLAETVRPPRGGLRGEADKRAYRTGSFVLRAELPTGGPRHGRVEWHKGKTLNRPSDGAEESYEALAEAAEPGAPHLTVTRVEPGRMRVVTSRGAATVPAWLFSLEGYEAPLVRAAVVPSAPPRSPVEPIPGVPLALKGPVSTSADGRVITVIAHHGVCDRGAGVEVLETRGSVVLSAFVKGPRKPGLCTKQLASQRVTVTLCRPVFDRVLLDATTGRPLPQRPWTRY